MGFHTNYDLIVFDMEDAIIDQGRSLCTAISRGVDAYLTGLLGIPPDGGPVFETREVDTFCKRETFSTPDKVMQALLAAAVHWLPFELKEDDFDGMEGGELLAAVGRRTEFKGLTLGDLARRKNLQEFSKLLRSKGGGERGFARVRGLRNRWLVLAEGHIMMDNFVKRIFAETYLGEKLFLTEYGQPRQFYKGEGTIDLEESWNDPRDLSTLRKRCPLATVTRRGQAEVQHVLSRLDIARYLDVVVGRGSMGIGMANPEESRWIRSLGIVESTEADYQTKVAEAIERVRSQEGLPTVVRVAYVGDVASDDRGIRTLKERYHMTAIGCTFGKDRKVVARQREAGADMVVTEPRQMVRILSERHSRPRRHRY